MTHRQSKDLADINTTIWTAKQTLQNFISKQYHVNGEREQWLWELEDAHSSIHEAALRVDEVISENAT